MGILADALRGLIPQFWRSNGAGGLTSAQDARTYEEHVADAISELEARAAGSRWHQGSGAPAPALGQVYDQYLDNDTGDTHEYSAALGWRRTGNLHGKDGRTPVKNVDYFDGRTPVKGVDYFDGKDGKTPVKGVDYFDGKTPIKGVDYFDGADGSRIYESSAAPTSTDPGKPGDLFYHFLNGSQYSVYDYMAVVPTGQSPWRLRFTTPAGTSSGGTGGGTGTVKSVSVNGNPPVSPDTNGNVALTVAAGSTVTPVQTIGAGNATDIPSTAAVASAVMGVLNYGRYRFSVTQTTTLVPLYFVGGKVQVDSLTYNYNVASVTYEVSYYDANGDETKFSNITSLAGGSGLNTVISNLSSLVVNTYGYTVRVQFTLKAGRSAAEATMVVEPVN